MAARQAKDLCLRLLTDRARSRAELAEVLRTEEVPEPVVDSVLDRLEELRLIDDAAYAEALVRSRQRAGMAKRVVSRDLRAKGVADADAEAALATIDPEEEKEVAVALARRRAGRTAGLAEPVRRRRLVAFLARRGYPGDVAMAAVNEVLGAEAAGEVGDGSADEAADDGTSLEA